MISYISLTKYVYLIKIFIIIGTVSKLQKNTINWFFLISKLKSGRDISDKRICLGLTGSVFTRNHSSYTEMTIRKIREKSCLADITILTDTVLGALMKIINMNNRRLSILKINSENGKDSTRNENVMDMLPVDLEHHKLLRKKILPISTGLPETEKRNLRSMKLSSMDLAEAVEMMIEEEARGNRSLQEHVSGIVTLVKKITSAFRCGGRLFYIGAGTSGRLGILDASECPPTFKAPPHWVQGRDLYLYFHCGINNNHSLLTKIPKGIIAGGTKAIQNSIEGAEDSVEDGMSSVIDKDVCDKDVVLG